MRPDDSPGVIGEAVGLTFADQREVLEALHAADSDQLEDFGLRGAASSSCDPFDSIQEYVRCVDRMIRSAWTYLAFYDESCEADDAPS